MRPLTRHSSSLLRDWWDCRNEKCSNKAPTQCALATQKSSLIRWEQIYLRKRGWGGVGVPAVPSWLWKPPSLHFMAPFPPTKHLQQQSDYDPFCSLCRQNSYKKIQPETEGRKFDSVEGSNPRHKSAEEKLWKSQSRRLLSTKKQLLFTKMLTGPRHRWRWWSGPDTEINLNITKYLRRKGRLVAWADFHKDPQAAVQAPIQIRCQNEPWSHKIYTRVILVTCLIGYDHQKMNCGTLNSDSIHRSRRRSWRTLNESKQTHDGLLTWLCVPHQ